MQNDFIVTLHITLKLCKDKGKVVPAHVMKADGRVKVQPATHNHNLRARLRSAVSLIPQ